VNAAAGSLLTGATTVVDHDEWWTLLDDPAIDGLVAAGLSDNPTLGEAAARIDQAQAALGVERARRLPRTDLTASVSRSQSAFGAGGDPVRQTAAGIGPSLSWEVDLWGRIRETTLAARSRLDARTADAEDARLSVIAQIADAALRLRGCDYSLTVRDRDIASREVELSITRQRLKSGAVAPVSVAAAQSNLASARTEHIAQQETCLRIVDALVALSGMDAAAIRTLLPSNPTRSAADGEGATSSDFASLMPLAPPLTPALPASVLAAHPGVVAAEREVAARWSQIAVARAERLPRINLAAALSGQWLRTLGASSSYESNSLGADLTFPLFDGGAGAANVKGAEASYREAVATLAFTLRTAARDIEDALAAQQSATARVETSREAVEAALFSFSANEARWRAGSIALFELEDSRRQLNRAHEDAITAATDRARAWVELVRRTGPAWRAPATQLDATAAPERSSPIKTRNGHG
jgi:NodT family efflux transporter outer membrane factor (OMF) lipoprotein